MAGAISVSTGLTLIGVFRSSEAAPSPPVTTTSVSTSVPRPRGDDSGFEADDDRQPVTTIAGDASAAPVATIAGDASPAPAPPITHSRGS